MGYPSGYGEVAYEVEAQETAVRCFTCSLCFHVCPGVQADDHMFRGRWQKKAGSGNAVIKGECGEPGCEPPWVLNEVH